MINFKLPTKEEYEKSISISSYEIRQWSEPKYQCSECGGGMCKNLMVKEIDDFNKTKYQIKIGVRDWDDFDIGYIYTADSEKQFFDVLHELINWMNDLEHGVAYYYEDLIEDLNGKKEFFPNYMGCKREGW